MDSYTQAIETNKDALVQALEQTLTEERLSKNMHIDLVLSMFLDIEKATAGSALANRLGEIRKELLQQYEDKAHDSTKYDILLGYVGMKVNDNDLTFRDEDYDRLYEIILEEHDGKRLSVGEVIADIDKAAEKYADD